MRLERKEPKMLIIGCDYQPSLQQIAEDGIVPARRIFEALQHFRETRMRIENYLACAVRDQIDAHIESSNDCPCHLTRGGRSLMRPIIESFGWDRIQDVPGQVVFNFEPLPVEVQRADSSVIRHCFFQKSARSARVEDSPYSLWRTSRKNIPAAVH